jgi:hypothetical protein
MRTRWIIVVSLVLAAVALGWTLRLHEPPASDERSSAVVTDPQDPAQPPDQPTAEPHSVSSDGSIDTTDRVQFNDQAREFFAQAPALPPEEARRRADALSQELSRIERAGGMSAGETFLLRAGLIRATEPDERRQLAQIKALKERYEADSRQRSAQASAQSDPMFQLYKVRESEIVAEVMSLQTIPDGLSREEYLRRRLQAAREQLLSETM